MLTIKNKKPVWYIRTLEAVTLTVAIIGLFYIGDLVFSMWQRDLCGSVAVSDYQDGSAPAKCQILWKQGRL